MLSTAALLLAAATCPTERAEYRLSADRSITARFYPVARSEDWRSGVALHLMWYGTPNDKRDSAPRAFFDFIACRASNADIAAPRIEFPAVP